MIFKNETYDLIKYGALVVLPALATLVGGIAKIWGLPFGQEISQTIVVVDLFLGALVKVSADAYNEDGGDSYYGGSD